MENHTTASATFEHSKDEVGMFMNKVYGYTTLGVFLSLVTGLVVSLSPALLVIIFGVPFLFYALLIGEIILVHQLAKRAEKMSVSALRVGFLGYAVMSGLTLSVLFLAFELISIISILAATTIMYAGLAGIGYATKKDLSGFGPVLTLGLLGVIIASVINLFLGSSDLDFIVSAVGVLVFMGLTIYDAQKIKHLLMVTSTEEEKHKASLLGALVLYLDFVNLFILLLRLLGKRK